MYSPSASGAASATHVASSTVGAWVYMSMIGSSGRACVSSRYGVFEA